MRLKTRLFAGASTLALVGGLAAFAVPAHAAITPTVIGACTGAEALASIKTDAGTGITNVLQNSKISVKSITGQTMTCSGLLAGDGAVDPGSLKSSIAGSASCDTSLTPPFPPSGKIGWSAAGGTVKEQGYVRFAGSDPAINYYVDVINVHGLITKGAVAGADIDGGLFQNPTVKDKTTGATFGAFTGVDMNPADDLIIGASCQFGTSAGALSFNNGLGGAKGPVAAPTAITLTMVGNGLSNLESTGAVAGKIGACPCVQAPGLIFSVY